MSLSEYEEFAFEAMGLYEEDPVRYWSEKSAEQERLKERLEEAGEIRIGARDGPDALGRGTYVRELGGDAEYALRRGLYRTHRGLGQRYGVLRRTCRDSGT